MSTGRPRIRCGLPDPVPAAAVYRRGDALRYGLSDSEIRHNHRYRRWRRLRRGAYVDRTTLLNFDTPEQQHQLLIDAVLPGMAEQTVLSHQSAAVIYGCPMWQIPLGRVHVTRNRRYGGRIKPDVQMHCAPVHEVAVVDDYQLTTPARTVVDLARTLSSETALVVGDALVGIFGISRDELAIELERAKFRRGIAHAKRVVARLDGRSESVGESRSRMMLERLGLPAPMSQGNVFDAFDNLIGRVDFYYEKPGVLCEFDGRVKYGRLPASGRNPTDAVHREKLREETLRSLGFQVVRWTWADLSGDRVADRLLGAIHRGARITPSGRITPAPRRAPRPLRIRPMRNSAAPLGQPLEQPLVHLGGQHVGDIAAEGRDLLDQ